jgi:glycosyltransferase involved in cell wall biosynthesis
MVNRSQLSGASSMPISPAVKSTSAPRGEGSGASPHDTLPPYVLITPARNEEAFIKNTLDSMVRQTHRPVKWVIVDDGSTDRTPQIVQVYAERYRWIELVRRAPRKDRNFAGKVYAFNDGLERVRNLQVGLIGNLDADISFGVDHFEFLTKKFIEDPELGVAGTAYFQGDWDSTRDSFEGQSSVHGACQLFRYECFLDIGGYQPNPAGGVDWIAVTTARMKGWKTRNYPERYYHHERTMGTAERSTLGAAFDYGKKDYFLGGSPVWEFFRVIYRMTQKPILLGGLALASGYCLAALRRMERPVSLELMRFHRREQIAKLRFILASIAKLKKVQTYLPADKRGLTPNG